MPEPAPVDPTTPSLYRLAPLLVVRFIGAYLVVLAVVIFAITAAIVATDGPLDGIVAAILIGLVGLFVLVGILRIPVICRFDEDGYAVRMIRAAETRSAAWAEVEEAETARLRGTDCLVLRLSGDRRTVLPVRVLDADPNDVVRDAHRRLAATRGRGNSAPASDD